MSKKKNNQYTQTQVNEVEQNITEEAVDTLEETVTEEVTEEVVEPVTEESTDKGETVEEVKEVVVESPIVNEVDPLPEKDGKIYISLGKDLTEAKLCTISSRLKKAGYDYIATATGEVVVGPFKTEDDAITARKAIIAKGLKGTIVTFD